jgi:hypothetical protein
MKSLFSISGAAAVCCVMLLAPPTRAVAQNANSALPSGLPAKAQFGAELAKLDPTSPEAQYAEVCRQIREDDKSFQEQWRKADRKERVNLRSARFQKHQQQLARLSDLGKEIAKKQKPVTDAVGESVAAPAGAKPDDTIRDLTTKDLEKMGVAVKPLHQGQP